jgi:hypothetical protein
LYRYDGIAGELGLEQWYVLSPFALAIDDVAARLEPGGAELVDDVVDRLHLGASVDSAALESVG